MDPLNKRQQEIADEILRVYKHFNSKVSSPEVAAVLTEAYVKSLDDDNSFRILHTK